MDNKTTVPARKKEEIREGGKDKESEAEWERNKRKKEKGKSLGTRRRWKILTWNLKRLKSKLNKNIV